MDYAAAYNALKPIEIRVRIAYDGKRWHVEDDHNIINFTTSDEEEAVMEIYKVTSKITDFRVEQILALNDIPDDTKAGETPVSRNSNTPGEHQEEK